MTEIFVEDDFFLNCTDEESHITIDHRIEEVSNAMSEAIRQPGAKVKVTRWFPGVLQAIVEEVKSKTDTTNITSAGNRGSVKELLAKEATKTLESKRNIQIAATTEKSLDEIKREMGIPIEHDTPEPPQATVVEVSASPPVTDLSAAALPPPTTTRRRVRQKMRSTPVTGGSLFDGPKQPPTPEEPKIEVGWVVGSKHSPPRLGFKISKAKQREFDREV